MSSHDNRGYRRDSDSDDSSDGRRRGRRGGNRGERRNDRRRSSSPGERRRDSHDSYGRDDQYTDRRRGGRNNRRDRNDDRRRDNRRDHRRYRDDSPIDDRRRGSRQNRSEDNRRKDDNTEKTEIKGCEDMHCLDQVEEITVHETVEIMEVFSGIETNNKFRVKNSAGQQLYFAGEETDYCTRRLCGSRRGFIMHIADTTGKEVMRVKRKFRCLGGCCWCACLPCFSYEVAVYAPAKTKIGYVSQSWSLIRSCFNVYNEKRNLLMYITGPFCIWDCCCFEPKFFVYDAKTGKKIGRIKKRWTEGFKDTQMFSRRDNFSVKFYDLGLERRRKALLLGSVFLINMMHFNKESEKRDLDRHINSRRGSKGGSKKEKEDKK